QQTWAVDQAFCGGPHQPDVRATGIEHRRETAAQRCFEMLAGAQGTMRRMNAIDRADVERGADGMKVRVDQPGQNGVTARIHRRGRRLVVSRRSDARDAAVAHIDAQVRLRSQALAVEDPAAAYETLRHLRQNVTRASTPYVAG